MSTMSEHRFIANSKTIWSLVQPEELHPLLIVVYQTVEHNFHLMKFIYTVTINMWCLMLHCMLSSSNKQFCLLQGKTSWPDHVYPRGTPLRKD